MTDHDLAATVIHLHAEVERLRQWKAEATQVLSGWDKVCAALNPDDAPLGESRSSIALREVQRLRAELDRRTNPDLAAHLRCPTCGSEGLTMCTNACRWPDDEPSPWLVIPNIADLIDGEAHDG